MKLEQNIDNKLFHIKIQSYQLKTRLKNILEDNDYEFYRKIIAHDIVNMQMMMNCLEGFADSFQQSFYRLESLLKQLDQLEKCTNIMNMLEKNEDKKLMIKNIEDAYKALFPELTENKQKITINDK